MLLSQSSRGDSKELERIEIIWTPFKLLLHWKICELLMSIHFWWKKTFGEWGEGEEEEERELERERERELRERGPPVQTLLTRPCFTPPEWCLICFDWPLLRFTSAAVWVLIYGIAADAQTVSRQAPASPSISCLALARFRARFGEATRNAGDLIKLLPVAVAFARGQFSLRGGS